jgi:hypothetical protein
VILIAPKQSPPAHIFPPNRNLRAALETILTLDLQFGLADGQDRAALQFKDTEKPPRMILELRVGGGGKGA